MREKLTLKEYTHQTLLGYGQNQFHPRVLPTSCSSYSFSIIINLLTGSKITTGFEVDEYLVRHGYKSRFFGIPSILLPRAIKGLTRFLDERHISFPFNIEYRSFAQIDDLIDYLHKDIPTIIEVSWGTTFEVIRDQFSKGPASAVGHYLVLSAFDPAANVFSFLDPGNGAITNYTSSSLKQIWLDQQNVFIKKGSAVVFIAK